MIAIHPLIATHDYILASLFECEPRHTGLRGASSTRERDSPPQMSSKLTPNSPSRQAPEVMRMDGYSTPADVFSFGLILLELVTGISTKTRFESIGIENSSISSWHASENRLDLESIIEEMKADEALETGRANVASTKPTKHKRPQTWSNEKITSRSNVMKSALKATTESFKGKKAEERSPSNGMSAIDALDLVRSCWSEDPSKRPSMKEVARKLQAGNGDVGFTSIMRSIGQVKLKDGQSAPAEGPAQDQRKQLEELQGQLEAERKKRVQLEAENAKLRDKLSEIGSL